MAKPCGLNVVPCGAPELYGGILRCQTAHLYSLFALPHE